MAKFTPTRLLLVAALLCTTSYLLDIYPTGVAPWRDIVSAVTSLVGLGHCRGHGMTDPSVAATTASTTGQDEPDLLPNVDDPDAVDAQTVCPGYTASNVVRTAHGFNATLTLAGPAVCEQLFSALQDTKQLRSATHTAQTLRSCCSLSIIRQLLVSASTSDLLTSRLRTRRSTFCPLSW